MKMLLKLMRHEWDYPLGVVPLAPGQIPHPIQAFPSIPRLVVPVAALLGRVNA